MPRNPESIHRLTHETYVEGCLNCKLLTVSISADALPTRASGRYREIKKTEAGWHKDIPAYRELVKEGYQPDTVDGAAKLAEGIG